MIIDKEIEAKIRGNIILFTAEGHETESNSLTSISTRPGQSRVTSNSLNDRSFNQWRENVNKLNQKISIFNWIFVIGIIILILSIITWILRMVTISIILDVSKGYL